MPTGNTQQQINYGASANDGQGDPLRTAFIKTDENFDNVWLAGPVGSNVRITNNTIGVLDTNGNLILSPNGVGVIQTNNHVVPRLDRTYDLGTANLRYRTVYANAATFQTLNVVGDFSVGGNLTVSGNIIEMGNIVTDALTIQLANTAANAVAANGAGITVGSNDNIATMLYNSTSNTWVMNIGASITGNVTAPYFIGNGSLLTGITSYANANAAAYGEAGWAGNIIPSANAVYSLGDASHYWSNLWVANNTIYIGGVPLGMTAGNVLTVGGNAVLTTGSNTSVSTTGNITANYFLGNGSQLTGLPSGGASTGNIVFTQSLMQSNVSFNGLNLDDGSNVRLFSAGDSPIVLVTNSGGANAGSPSTWTFATNGTFYPADDVRAGASGGRFIQDCANGTTSMRWYNIEVESESQLIRAYTGDPDGAEPETERGRISVDWTSNTQSGITIVAFSDDGNVSQEYTWKFQGDSTAEFAGNVRMGASAASQINTVANSSGDGGGYTTLQLIPDETLVGTNQFLIIDPTVGPPGHIHIRAGGPQDNSLANLYLGGENSYVKLPAGENPNVEIAANTFVWAFGSAGAIGELTLPTGEGVIKVVDDSLNLVSLNTSTGNANSVYLGSGGGLGFFDQEIGGNWLQIFRSGVEPEITVPYTIGLGSANLYINNSSSGNVRIWNFDTTGNINLPDGGILGDTYDDGLGTGLQAAANGYAIINSADQRNYVEVDDTSVEIVTDWPGNAYTWNFGADGDLLAPGAISAVGNITAPGLLIDTVTGITANAGNININQITGLGGWLNATGANLSGNVNAGSLNVTDISISGNIISNLYADGEVEILGNVNIENSLTVDGLLVDTVTGITANAGNIDINQITGLGGYLNATGVVLSGNITGNTAGFAIGYRDIPQVSFSANATAAEADAGKHYYSTTAGNLALTLPDNSSVAFPTGATLTVVVNAAGNVLVNQGTGVSLYQAGSSTTGNRVVGAYGLASVMKVAANTWVISGTGVY